MMMCMQREGQEQVKHGLKNLHQKCIIEYYRV